MVDADGLGGAYRRAADANLRYIEAWGRLATTWLTELADVGRAAASSQSSSSSSSPAPARDHHDHDATRRASPPPTAGAVATSGPTLVLEGTCGASVVGAFLVENNLGHPVQARVLAETADGNLSDSSAGGVVLDFEPEDIDLAPLERCVVRVTATIPVDMNAGSDYRTTIKVPDLPGSSIAALVRCVKGAEG